MKKVSVIIPVYNVEPYLRKCLDSVIGQTYENLEIILINDGTKDASLSICEEYKNKDSITYNICVDGLPLSHPFDSIKNICYFNNWIFIYIIIIIYKINT